MCLLPSPTLTLLHFTTLPLPALGPGRARAPFIWVRGREHHPSGSLLVREESRAPLGGRKPLEARVQADGGGRLGELVVTQEGSNSAGLPSQRR